MKKIATLASSLAVGALAILPVAAFAQTDTSVGASANTSVTASTNTSTTTHMKGTKSDFSVSGAITKADTAIEKRITDLTSLSARIGQMKNISSSEKSSLQAGITTEIGNLNTLKATIDSQTVAATLKTDIGEITKDNRVYMLMIPQGRITAASDRIMTIVSDMNALAPKLQTRITEAQTAGKDVSGAAAAYTDMQAKVADANTQASAAVSAIASLQPDQGNKTVEASNTAALKASAAKVKASTADLKAARADITTILNAVKGTGSASTTASAGVQ